MKKLLLSIVLLTSVAASHAQWTQQNTGFTAPSRGISDIEIVDANTVWALAYDGASTTNVIREFTRTTNGGATWTPGTISAPAGMTITNISPVSATTAWAGFVNSTAGFGGIMKTTDGGVTWTEQNADAYDGTGAYFNFVHFFDAQNGVSMGDPVGNDFEIWYTTNGGTTWNEPSAFNIPPFETNEFGYTGSFETFGDAIWFTTSTGRLYRSLNKGINWTAHDTPVADFGGAIVPTSRGTLHVANANTGVILGTANTGTSYTLYTSTNLSTGNPITWTASTWNGGPYTILTYIPGSTALVGVSSAQTGGGSAYSTNNGATWIPIDTGTQRTAVDFLNGTTGWSGGFSTNSTTGGIYKYTGAALRVNDVASQPAIAASPNPTNGLVRLNGATINEVAVYDLLGKQVYASSFDAMSEVEIDLSSLQTGAYMLKATSDTGAVKTIKIMKN